MFLGQHQPGFPSSSIKVYPRSQSAESPISVGSKLGSSDWPDLGVSITSKSSSGQWVTSTAESADTSNKGRYAIFTTSCFYHV